MKKLLIRPIKRLGVIAIMLLCLLLENLTVGAQCYEDFYVYQVSPYGQLCSPQYATIRAEYYYSGSYISGEFRWYTSNTDPNPVQTNSIYSDFGEGLTADYSLYAENGTTAWVSFYNYNTGCESYRTPYTFYISTTPYLYQDYALKCGYESAKVQLSSNVTGSTFQLYKLHEYYDPYYGNVQDYQIVQSNSTGYFEINDFDPATDAYKYFAKIYHPYSCATPYYYQLYFDITSTSPPSVSGNLSVAAGSGTTLTAIGTAATFRWYDAVGNLVNEGWNYITPSNLVPGTYAYQVRGVSWDGNCISDPATVTVTVSLPDITYTPLFTSSNFIKTIDLSKSVGTVAGASGTTPSGGVTYSLPIYTPAGTNGIEPSVSVSYNSQSASGVAGWGWNITGLSAISRTGKNIYHNGVVKPVTYTADDAFLLDGMRLNVISGSNGSNGSTYAGEAESFATITSFTSGSANNPGWFKVFAKDGSVMEFGNTLDSRVLTDNGTNVMLWRLNKILDVNGNYIEFVYDNNLRDSRIKTIKYTGNLNAGLAPYNSINFEYKLRSDKNMGYDAGSSLSSSHLLDKIVVKASSSVTKSYQFNYGFDNINSFLKEVVEVAGDDITTLNSTIFLYGPQPQNLVTTATVALTGPYDFFSGDYDADGKTDLMAVKSYYDGNAKARLHHEYSLINGVNESGYGLLYTKTLPQNISSEILADKKAFNFLNADYNGDGRDDVLQIISNTEQLNCLINHRRIINNIVINNTKSFNSQTSYTDYQEQNIAYPTDGWGYSYQVVSGKGNFFIPGDFDGDGKQDYILFLAKKRLTSTCGTNRLPYYDFDFKGFITSPGTNEVNKEILNFGFGSNPHGAEFYAGTFANADAINVLDFDGDGKMEILVTKDGLSYVLTIQRLAPSSGYSFAATVVYTTTDIIKDNRVFPGDFNGDRKTDLLVRNNNGIWKILYSTGNTFATVPFAFNQTVAFTGNYGDDLLQVSDFNGDGKSDILHGFPVWVNGSSSSSKFSLYYSKGTQSATPFYYEQYDYNNILASGKYGSSEGIVLGDFNGDGRIDLLNRYNVNAPADFISLKSFGKERLLAKVTDGHNTTTTFNYKLLTDKSTYPYFYDRTISLDDPANQNPYNYVQLPLYAVSSVIVPDGIGGNNTTSYNYENAVVHRAAKGFLGFKKITTKNEIADVTSTTENEINTEFAVPFTVKQTTKLTSTGALLSESQITNSFVNLSTGYGDKRYLQKIDKTLSIDYLNGKASETVNTIDLYGNIIQTVFKNGPLSGTTVNAIETSTTNASYGIHNTPVAAKPDNVTVTNSRTAMPPVSSTSTFTYNANGLLATQTVFSGLPKAVTTSYSYDPYGNPLTAITSSTGLTNRTSTNTYDAKGRFLLSKQLSSAGITQTETFEYADDKWGKPTKITSNDCLTTSFEYDLFGRLKTTTLPQGFTVTNSILWDVSGNNVSYAFTDYPGGNPDTKTWYDKLGRPTKTQAAGFNNQWLTRLTSYNAKGQVATQTNDYYPTETALVTTNTYDVYGRMLSAANTINTVTNAYTALSDGEAQVVTTSSIGQTSTKISDATGKIIKAIDNGGQLNFTYDSRGNQTEVKHGSNILVASIYDSYGRQTSLTDKNAGTITYSYDAFGQLVQQTDAKNNTYTMQYDGLGRITNRTGTEGTTTYEYGTTTCNNNNLTKITGFNGVVKEYTYDGYKRPITEKLTVDGIPYTTSFSYNQYNSLIKTVYPSGIEENKTYDVNGDLLTVTGGNAGSPVTLFTAGNVNGFGQYTGFTSGNGKTTQNTFYYGIPTRYYTPGVQDLNLTFDYTKGNLTNRNDAIKGLSESFAFDNLNRLTSATVNGVQQFAMSYDGTTTSSMGNIVSKTDAGNYVYRTDKINAVAYITNPAGAQVPPSTISTIEQQVSYTPFLKTASVTEAPYSLDFTYGPDYQRVKTLLKNNNSLEETRLYIGSYEKQIIAGGATREVHYVSGGNGLCAILVKEGGIVTPYYVYTDHLGSLLTITDVAGTVVGEQNFDAWGRKRNPVNWQYAGVPTTPAWLYRGYTSHEHLPNFTLINMNGRMYDPIQGRMISPDNYVATPFGTQGYNRYSYANNNPLSYVDPDGNHPLIIVGILVGGFLKGMQYDMSGKGTFLGGFWRGALVSGAGSALGVGLAGSFSSLGMVGGGIVQGGITGLATGGLGAALDGRSVFKGALFGGISGGIVGGVFGGIQRASIGDSDIPTPPGDTNTGEYFSSNDEIDAFINNNIGDVNAIESNFKTNITLASGNNLPPGYSFNNNTNMMYNVRKEMVGGSTQIKGGWFTSLKSKIFMSPGIKGYFYNGKNFSQVAISHEILHAYHYSAGLGNGINSESAASAYSLAYAKSYNMTTLFPIFRSQISNYPSVYSWQKLSRLINMGLKY